MQNFAGRPRVTALLVATLVATLVGLAPESEAQASAQHTPTFASPFLPADHWAVDAARRAALLGLAPGSFAWGDGSSTQGAAGWVLREAIERARNARSPLHPTIESEWIHFAREFPVVAARIEEQRNPGRPRSESASAHRRPAITSTVAAGFVAANGRLLPVRSLDRTRENFSPPEPLADLADADLRLQAGTLLGRMAAVEVAGGRSDEQWRLRDWQLVAATKSIGAWIGKRAPDYGPGVGGGLVFDGRAAFTGGGVAFVNPVRAPWIFRHLGAIRGEAFLSRVDSNAATRRPWVFASRASISPHPRLLLATTQAFMFGGSGQPPFTWRNFKEMFLTHAIKVAGREFENGIASIEARWRPPLPRLPAVVYVEWGADDNHSAMFRFPAVVVGVTLPAVPAVPALSLGLERASFAKPCSGCGGCACEYYATWYRHYVFMDGWTVDRRPIGHPLGGDGTEWLLHGRYDDAARRVRVGARGFVRDRGGYNLFAPARQGRSAGGAVSAEYRVTPALELRLDAGLERGRRDWSTSSLGVGVRWLP